MEGAASEVTSLEIVAFLTIPVDLSATVRVPSTSTVPEDFWMNFPPFSTVTVTLLSSSVPMVMFP